MVIQIKSKDRQVSGEYALPASKSISNRLLVLQALSGNTFHIRNISDADDTKKMLLLLDKIKESGYQEKPVMIDAGNAGTVLRFLCGYLSTQPGYWLLTGSDRMKRRPISPLVNALRDLGACIEYVEKQDYLPILIEGKALKGGDVYVSAAKSSQFVSSLLLLGPSIKDGINIILQEKVSSEPYIRMTILLLKQLGVDIAITGQKIMVKECKLKNIEIEVEADWSSASYWYEFAALSKQSDVLLIGLKESSLQGDSILVDIFEKLGVYSEFINKGLRLTKGDIKVKTFNFDFTHHPDLAPAVIVSVLALGVRSRFTGLDNLVYKESDRLTGLVNIAKEMNAEVTITDNSKMEFFPNEFSTRKKELTINAENDHRMAMCVAPLSLLYEKINIIGGESVLKSYPAFWDQLKTAGFEVKKRLTNSYY